jgi:hypothetical protein
VRRRQRPSWDKFATSLEQETYRTQPKVYKISKQICKYIKETGKIQGNIDENVSVQCYEKLPNTRNMNDPGLVWRSNNNSDTLIILDELEKALKLTKMVKAEENIILIHNYISTHQENLK